MMRATLRRLMVAGTLAFLAAAPAHAQAPMTPAQERAMETIFREATRGRALFEAGRYAEAETIFIKNLADARRHFPSEPLTIAAALHNLAAAQAELGRLAEAEKTAREALRLRETNRAHVNAIASSRALLASILKDLAAEIEARQLMESAIELTTENPEVDRSNLIGNYATLAHLFAATGDLDQGIGLVNELFGIVEDLPARDQFHVYQVAGRVSSMAGYPEDAESFYRRAVAIASEGYKAKVDGPAPTAADRAQAISNLASLLMRRGRTQEAAPLFAQAADLMGYGEDRPSLSLANTLNELGDAFRAEGKVNEAWDVQRKALDMRTALLPETHPLIADSMNSLGMTLLNAGMLEPAEQAFNAAIGRQIRIDNRLGAARSALNLALAQAAAGRLDAAVATAHDGRVWLDGALPDGHPLRIKGTFNEAWLLLAAGRNAEALALARTGLAAFVASNVRGEEQSTGNIAIAHDERRQVIAFVAAAWAEAKGQ